MFLQSFGQMFPLFLLMVIGILLTKAGYAPVSFRKQITDLCFVVLFPASIINAFNMELTIQMLADSARLLLVGFLWIYIPFGVAYPITKLRKTPYARANPLLFAVMFGNLGFAGMGMVNGIYGSQGIFYTIMIGMAYRLSFSSLGVALMQRGSGADGKKGSVFAVLKTPPIITLFLMVPLVLLNIRLPQVVYDTAGMLNSCLAPLGMMITGMSIADHSPRQLLKSPGCYVISALRLLVFPIAFGLLLRWMGVTGTALYASVLAMGMPVAANCALLAQKYDCDTQFASGCVLISTVFSLVTLPLLILFAQAIG